MERSTHRTADGVELAVWTLLGNAKPDFLLIHGLASNARVWDGVATRLNDRGHAVVSLDQRGHGRSAKPSGGFDFATLSSDLAGLIEATMRPPVIACGQSFGGNLVLELAVHYPHLVSGVVCVDGGFVDLRDSWPRWEDALKSLTPPSLDHLRAESLASSAAEMYPGWPEAGIAAQLENLEVGPDGRVARRLALAGHLQILRSMWEQSPKEVAAKVGVPVLVLVAGDGPSHHQAQVEEFALALARSRVEHLPGHHDLHAEQPEKVFEVIEKAISDGFLQ